MSESSKFNVLAVNWFQYDDCISDSSVDLADVLVSVDKYDYIVYAHNNMIIHFKREQIEQYVAKRDGNYVVSSYNEPKKTKSVGVAPWRCLKVEKNVKSMKVSCDSTLIGIIYDDYSLEIISLPSLINLNTKFCVYKNDDKDFISMEWNPEDDKYLLLIRNNGIYLHNVISRKMKQIDEANNSFSNISWFNKSTFFASHNNNIKKFTFENNSLDSSVTNEEVTITVDGFVVTEIKAIKGLSDNIIEVLALIQDDDYKVLLLLRHNLVDGTSENMLPYDYPENPDEKNIFYMRYLEKIKVLVVGNNYSPEKIELSYPASYAMIVDIVQHDESSVADSGETNMYRHLSKMNHPNDEINKKVCGMCVLNNCIRLKNGQHDGFLILVLFSDGKLLVSLCETNATQGHYARVEEVSKTIPYKEFVPEAKEIQEIVDITDDDESVVVHEERNMVNITIDSLNNELIELETLSRSIESKLRCFEWIQAANAATKDICDSHSPELESLLQRNNHSNIVSSRWKSASVSSSSAGVGGDSSQDKINRRWHKLVDQASSHETMKVSENDVANIYSKKKENPTTKRLLIDGKKNKTTPKSAEKKDIAKEVKAVTKEVVKESKTVSFGQIAPLALDLNKATPTSILQSLGAASTTDTKVVDAFSLLSVKSPAAASTTDTKVTDAFSLLSSKSPAAASTTDTKVTDAFSLLSVKSPAAASTTDTKVADAFSLLSSKSPAAASTTDTKVTDAFSLLSVKSPAAASTAETKVADAFSLLSSKGSSNAFTALQIGKVDSPLSGISQTESVPEKQTVATKKVDEVAPVSAVIDKLSTDAVKVADSAKSVADTPPVLSEEEKIVSEIKELYKRYNADKLGEVDSLVKKYGPNELLQKIKAKYEKDGKNTAQAAETVSTTTSATKEPQSTAKDTPPVVKAESPSRPTTIPSLPVSSVKPLTGTPKTDDIKPLPLPLGAFDIRKQNTEAVKSVADTPVLSEEEKIISEIKELYKRYNADKLGEVDTLLKKYKPSELLQKIKAKYEKDGSNSTTPTNTMSGITAPQSGAKGALSLMKTQSSPSNTSTMSPWGVAAVKTQSPSGPTTGTSLFGQQSQLGMGQQPLLTRASSNPMSSTPSNPMSSTPSFGNASPVVYGGGGGVFGANTNSDEAIINEIKELYKRYNADKLGEVDTLLKKYKPSELLQKIKAKYEKDGSNSTTPTNTMSGGVSTGQQWGSATSSLFRPNSSPSGPTTGTSLFGQQSQLGMGQQPLITRASSNPMSSTPSFGNTSPVVYGGGGGVFGANTSNGQSSFGQVSQIGSSSPGRVGVFGASPASNNQSLVGAQGGQPLFGQTSQPSQSLFGSRSLPNTNGQVFGQTSSLGSANTFGQSGQSSWLGNR